MRTLLRAPLLLGILASLWIGGSRGAMARSADENAEVTAPVPLHTPTLKTPIEVAGTGLAPEVSLSLTVDARGGISDIEIVSIDPPSEFDDLFERVVRETLARWRYFPATRDGESKEITLRWTAKFLSRDESSEVDEDLLWRQYARAEQEAEDFRKQILTLPLKQRIALLEQNAGQAGKHMKETSMKRADTARFTVYADAPDGRMAQILASNLEATFNILAGIIGETVVPQPEPFKIMAFMYSTENQFDALKRDIRGIEWAAGFYNPAGMIAFHMQMISNESLLGVMLHEAVHAYLDRYIARPGVVLPRWLDEGLAEYLGNSTLQKKTLIPGKTRRTEVYRGAWGAAHGRSVSLSNVDDVRQAMRDGKDLTIAELIRADIEEFYGEKRELYYPTAWLLIHFLRHGRSEWTDESFASLVLYVAEGYQPAEAFRSVYGDPDELQAEFRKYVKKL